MTIPTPETFADMAVALKLAAGKLRLDLDQLEVLAARIEMSNMGLLLAQVEMKKNLDLVVAAYELLKSLVDEEKAVRAIAAKPKLRLFSRLAGMIA